MGREGRGLTSEEAEEKERSNGGAGEGTELSRSAEQVRDHPALPGWTAAGVASERPATCHLLPCVALA